MKVGSLITRDETKELGPPPIGARNFRPPVLGEIYTVEVLEEQFGCWYLGIEEFSFGQLPDGREIIVDSEFFVEVIPPDSLIKELEEMNENQLVNG